MAQDVPSETGLSNNQAVISNGISSDDIKVADKHEPRDSLSLCNKLCYAIGGVPYQITATALGFFLQIYLLDVAELNPIHASKIVFAGRVWDAITDPAVGYFVSRSPWTRFGRLLAWIVLSTPFAVVAYFLLWYVPPFEEGKVFWYLVFYCLFVTLQTCFHVPYTALTMFICSEQQQRDSCSAYRMTMEVLAMLIGTGVQGQIVGRASAPCITEPSAVIAELNNSTSMSVANTITLDISLDDTRFAYMMASCAISAIYIFCATVLFFGVKEKKESCAGAVPMSFLQAVRTVMGYGPYAILNIAVLLTGTGFYFLEGNFAVFCTYTLESGRNHFQNILLVSMISAALSVPFWHWFGKRFGKKTAFYVGNSSAIPFVILVVSVEKNLTATYIFSFAAGAGIGAALLLPWSMLPDVVDDFKVHNPDSIDHETIFFSFYVFFQKFAAGLSLGISTLSLYFGGYITRGCSQPDVVKLTLRLLVSAVPVLFILAGLVVFYYYPINEETRQRNCKLLQKLQESKPTPELTQEIQEDSPELSNMV